MKSAALVLAALTWTAAAAAQDTSAVDRGVRVGITYASGYRPGVALLPGVGLDSVRAILQRDLDYSDRFELILVPAPDAPAAGPRAVKPTAGVASVNYGLYVALGAAYAIELVPADTVLVVRLHDVIAGQLRREERVRIPAPSAPDFRLQVHGLADEIVRWITGQPGIAATQLAYVTDGRVYLVDSDGARPYAVTADAETALSPVWSPDGRRLAFTQLNAGTGPVILLDLATGVRRVVPSTGQRLNITPGFSPDGKLLAFARVDEDGTDVYVVNITDWCCAQRLTVGRYADNLSPTFSPDGRRIAFISTRSGLPQVYVMAADGTDQELLAPFDYGVTGSSNGPEWSSDGANLAFHRDVAGSPQIFIMDLAGRRVRQLTSTGRNEDPTWAPDGRHLAFVSDRSGRRQLWVIDIETGRIRQLQAPGTVRLPSWSRRLVGAAAISKP